MKIAVNLALFFNDHRSSAWLYINKEIKNVKDLINKINTVFSIDNFFLKSANCFLPPTEDIKILSPGDEVFVCPLFKNLADEINSHVDNELNQPSTSSLKKSKKTKKHLIQDNLIQSTNSNNVEDSGPSKPKKSKRYSDESENKYNYFESDLSSGKKSSETTPDVKSLINTFEKKNLNTKPEKKINIIKTIIISPNQASTPIKNSNNKNVTETKENNVENVELESNDKNTIDTEENTEQIAGDVNDVQSKRKRKRVRKRKRAEKTVETILHPEPIVIKPIVEKAAPSTHIRFEDEFTEAEKYLTELPTRNNSPEPNLSTVKKETVNNVVKNKEVEKKNIAENVKKPKFDINNLSEDYVNQFPKITVTNPKIGDILAFKVLRLNEKYTPEVSTNIVGKIVNLHVTSNEIDFDIIFGHDQCKLPNGKFSLDEITEDDNNEILIKNNYYFSELIEPKLLFP